MGFSFLICKLGVAVGGYKRIRHSPHFTSISENLQDGPTVETEMTESTGVCMLEVRGPSRASHTSLQQAAAGSAMEG